jgi:hypothetical protein
LMIIPRKDDQKVKEFAKYFADKNDA